LPKNNHLFLFLEEAVRVRPRETALLRWLEDETAGCPLLCDDPDGDVPPPPECPPAELAPPEWANAKDGAMSATAAISNRAARCLVRALAMIGMFSSPAL